MYIQTEIRKHEEVSTGTEMQIVWNLFHQLSAFLSFVHRIWGTPEPEAAFMAFIPQSFPAEWPSWSEGSARSQRKLHFSTQKAGRS